MSTTEFWKTCTSTKILEIWYGMFENLESIAHLKNKY